MAEGKDWKSAWPEGHPNRTEYVSREQQTKNARRTNVPLPKDAVDWKSAWPKGHPNYNEPVTREEQARNARIQGSAAENEKKMYAAAKKSESKKIEVPDPKYRAKEEKLPPAPKPPAQDYKAQRDYPETTRRNINTSRVGEAMAAKSAEEAKAKFEETGVRVKPKGTQPNHHVTTGKIGRAHV